MRTTFKFDDEAHLMTIKPVFETDCAPGLHTIQGGLGENIGDILHRWIAVTRPELTVLYVNQAQATDANTWIATLVGGLHITFRVL